MGYNLLEYCELCGRINEKEKYSDYLRTINIGNDNSLYKGYFRPRLTSTEFYLLGRGQHTICSNRRQCNKRQQQKLMFNKEV